MELKQAAVEDRPVANEQEDVSPSPENVLDNIAKMPLWAKIVGGVIILLFLRACFWPDPEDYAETIVKQSLATPSSFRVIDSDVVWEGELKNGLHAYVAKVAFDADNLMGASIRGCALVAFVKDGMETKWNSDRAVNMGCENASALGGEAGLIEMVKEHNFGSQLETSEEPAKGSAASLDESKGRDATAAIASTEAAAAGAAAAAAAAAAAMEVESRPAGLSHFDSNAGTVSAHASDDSEATRDHVGTDADAASDAAEQQANIREAAARTERLQKEEAESRRWEAEQRVASERARAIQSREQEELARQRKEADALKRLQDEHAAKVAAEDAAGN